MALTSHVQCLSDAMKFCQDYLLTLRSCLDKNTLICLVDKKYPIPITKHSGEQRCEIFMEPEKDTTLE